MIHKEEFKKFLDFAEQLLEFAKYLNNPNNVSGMRCIDLEQICKAYYDRIMKQANTKNTKRYLIDVSDKTVEFFQDYIDNTESIEVLLSKMLHAWKEILVQTGDDLLDQSDIK